MLGHGFAGTERARDTGCAALNNGEQRILDALAGNQRDGRRRALGYRALIPDGPSLAKAQLMYLAVLILYLQDGVVYLIFAVGIHFGNHGFSNFWGKHAPVHNGRGFGNLGIHVADVQLVALLDLHGHIPQLLYVQRRRGAPAGNVGAAFFCNCFERTFDAVKDTAHNART